MPVEESFFEPNAPQARKRGGCLFWIGCLILVLVFLIGAAGLIGYGVLKLKEAIFPEEPRPQGIQIECSVKMHKPSYIHIQPMHRWDFARRRKARISEAFLWRGCHVGEFLIIFEKMSHSKKKRLYTILGLAGGTSGL